MAPQVEVRAVPLSEDVRITQRGRARVLPGEGELATLQEQLLQFLYMLCEVAAGSGLSVLVEPLDPRRTICLPEDADAAGLAYCRGLWG
jgi:hypothetical protein